MLKVKTINTKAKSPSGLFFSTLKGGDVLEVNNKTTAFRR